MMKILILILFFFCNGLSATLESDTSFKISDTNCNEKVLELKNTKIDNSNTNSIYSKIVRKLQSIYFSIKYYFMDIFYSIKNKETVTTTIPFNIKDNESLYNNDENKANRFIAHAAGKINNHIYTNSLEALNLNYKNGFRLFELDIQKTKDNIYVAVHSWKEWKEITKYKGSIPPTLKDYKNIKLYNQYTPLDINDINKWFCIHKDAVLVTDKINEPIKFSKKFISKKRLYMELFTISAVINGANYGINVMPTWGVLSKFRNNVVENFLELNITVIAASRRVVKKNKELLEKLKKNNIHVYAFHINYDDGIDEKYVICNELNYFYGIYADKWSFNKLKCGSEENVIK